MKRITKKWISMIVIVAVVWMLWNTVSMATGNDYNSDLEAAYGETFEEAYYDSVAGSPLELEDKSGVDTANGQLIVSRTDLALMGTGGIDLILNRYYNSNEAILGHPEVELVKELEVDTSKVSYKRDSGGNEVNIPVSENLIKKYKKALKDMFYTYNVGESVREDDEVKDTQRTIIVNNYDYNTYGIASGWRFDLPWIESLSVKSSAKEIPLYLHMGSKGSMKIKTSKNAATSHYDITGLENYTYSDIKLQDWKETVDGVECAYLLRDKTGLRTYFNNDGVVVLQKDEHNNTIKYNYVDKIYLSSIIDSVGRTVTFNYGEENGIKRLLSLSVSGNETAGGVSKKEVWYDYEERSYLPMNSGTIEGLVLKSAAVEGKKESYDYRTVERIMSTAGYGVASQRVSTNESYLLNKITANGKKQHYEYRPYVVTAQKRSNVQAQKRNVTVAGYYVTREYSEDSKTKKKSNGIKYDIFLYQDSRLIRLSDFKDGNDDRKPFGKGGFKVICVTSKYNPNKNTPDKTLADYIYKKEDINITDMELKESTKKSVRFEVYNSNKLLTKTIEYGKQRKDTTYTYDKDGQGSLLTKKTEKTSSVDGGSDTKKEEFSYDSYRNVIKEKTPKAYLDGVEEEKHTIVKEYYKNNEGYPETDVPYCRAMVTSQTEYIGKDTVHIVTGTVDANEVDYASVKEEKKDTSENVSDVTVSNYKYDAHGNEVQALFYPAYDTEGTGELMEHDYAFNELGQQIEKKVVLNSAKNPENNQAYIEETVGYDFFGNEVSYTGRDGMTKLTTYDSITGDIVECVENAGTKYETDGKTYVSTDQLKTMQLDSDGKCSITIQDGFGNTITTKNESAGTWTETTYAYDTVGGEEEEEKQENYPILEEKTYDFTLAEKKFIINEDGEQVANFYMEGKGNTLQSGTKYFYDSEGTQVGSASFGKGGMDASHCISWELKKETSQIKDGQTISVCSTKQLDPAKYQSEIDKENYYTQFEDAVLIETIVTTVTDASGYPVAETTQEYRGNSKKETKVINTYDEFGENTKRETITKKYQNRNWLPALQTKESYTYNLNGNVIETKTQSRIGEGEWVEEVTKSEYDEKNNVISETSPRGVAEGYSTTYQYDMTGNVISSQQPQMKKDGSISYQNINNVYDEKGRLIATEEEVEDGTFSRTEYTYDEGSQITMIKSKLSSDKAQYVQYVYDKEGHKVRQFTGMTSPLTLTVEEGSGEDTYSSDGKTYHISVGNQNKKDTIQETRYEYDERGNLVSQTDPEGRTETCSYDSDGNLVKSVDKMGNEVTSTYDYQNRVIETVTKNKKTGESKKDTYRYNAYGELMSENGTSFSYDDVSGLLTKEEQTLANGKKVAKEYAYDSGDNRTSLEVNIGGKEQLTLGYTYDGASRLASVCEKDGEVIAEYSYDVESNLAKRTVPEIALTSSYEYDYQGNLTTMNNQTENSGLISSYDIISQKNGQVVEETEQVQSVEKTRTYSYDLLGRLKKETKTGEQDISYVYDSNNNRKTMTTGDYVTEYTYNKNNELLQTNKLNKKTEAVEVVTYKNDLNGNQLAVVNRKNLTDKRNEEAYIDLDITLGDNRLNDNVVNKYDGEDQLISTLTKDSKVSYTYDAEGLRSDISEEMSCFMRIMEKGQGRNTSA